MEGLTCWNGGGSYTGTATNSYCLENQLYFSSTRIKMTIIQKNILHKAAVLCIT
jgi:hypothetical protein